MDRRNGGDHQAPPRPPKLLPRIHRPRAPDPMEVLNDMNPSRKSDRREETTACFGTTIVNGNSNANGNVSGTRPTIRTTVTGTETATRTAAAPQGTNSDQLQHLSTDGISKPKVEISEQEQQQKQQREQLNSITNASATRRTTGLAGTIIAKSPKTSPPKENTLAYNRSNNVGSNTNININTNTNTNTNNNTNSNSSNIANKNSSNNDNGISSPGTFVINNHTYSDPNHHAACPDNENYQIYHLTYLPQQPSSLSLSSQSSSSITAANSFTRRRPQPGIPSADAPWRISGNNSSFGSFLSHFQNADSTSASPVTLAQPRPESQRLTNEYVDTPLRTANHLQNASRMQHPAGQHDNNQTTTHHVLLLPQREQHQPRIGINETISSANTTVAATMGIDGTDGFIHSQNQKSQISSREQAGEKVGSIPSTLNLDGVITIQNQQRQLQLQQHQHQHQQQQQPHSPITKQPASTKSKPSFTELNSIQITSASNSPTGTPQQSSSNSITCPRCHRCRCEQCKSSGLPQKWLCKKTCLCSAESVLDYSTCVCCAKAIFYHCATQGDMDDEGDYVDDPCSCNPEKRLQRWAWLSALSFVLPCLCVYWPLRGCTWLSEKCYNRFAGRGCRCQQNTTSNMLTNIPLASHGNSADANSNIQGDNSSNHLQNVTIKSKGGHASGHHHYHHYHESVASRMLRKGDMTPEKRLLDTNADY